jgi:hypothetical protein
MAIKFFSKAGEPRKIVTNSIGNRPNKYPWRAMSVGDYFTVDLPKLTKGEDRRRVAMMIYTAACKFRARNPELTFASQTAGDVLCVTRVG